MENTTFVRKLITAIIYLGFFVSAYALDCTSSKQEWMKLRYTTLTGLASSANIDPVSNICPISTSSSCCNAEMEHEMYVIGQHQLVQHCNSWLKIARQMKNDSLALEQLFRSDLEQAKSRLHQFFSRIYGYNYKLHRSFFFGFFSDLEQYMAGKRGQLGQLIENFFSQLRDSIVSLIERSGEVSSSSGFGNPSGGSDTITGPLNSNNPGSGSLNEVAETKRIRCLSDRVAQLHPFDDVDVRLRARMLEAYPPARMLVNILSSTSQLLNYLVEQVVTQPQCVLGITRYRFCAVCAGQSLANVCKDSCPRLLASCLKGDLPNETQLPQVWPQLIDAIILATNRLERSFNFPAVNRNLQMDISEAITSLQTRYTETKSKFESECRVGSTNRKVPTIFNPINTNNMASGSKHQSSWPMSANSGHYQNRFVRSANYDKPSVSQELLAWQTRSGSSRNGNVHLGKTNYDSLQSSQQTDWSGMDNDNSPNSPEQLSRQASQIKRSYMAVRSLFSAPVGNLCIQDTSTSHNRTHNQNISTCWNPPDLPNFPPSLEITQILNHLNEASKRLHEASSNTRDPDILAIRISSKSLLGHSSHPKQSKTGSFSNSLNGPNSANQFLAQDQWQAPGQSRFSNQYKPVLQDSDIEAGSGFQPSNSENSPGLRKNVDNYQYSQYPDVGYKPPAGTHYNANMNPDIEGSGSIPNAETSPYFNQNTAQQWSSTPISPFDEWEGVGSSMKEWESSGASNVNVPIVQELETSPQTTTTLPTTTTSTITSSIVSPLVMTSSNTTASTNAPHTSLFGSRNVTVLETSKDQTSPIRTMVETKLQQIVTTSTPPVVATTTTTTSKSNPTSSTFDDQRRVEQPSPYGPLPDDEDNVKSITNENLKPINQNREFRTQSHSAKDNIGSLSQTGQVSSNQEPDFWSQSRTSKEDIGHIPQTGQSPANENPGSWSQNQLPSQNLFWMNPDRESSGLAPPVYTPQIQGSQSSSIPNPTGTNFGWSPTNQESTDQNKSPYTYNEGSGLVNPQSKPDQPYFPSSFNQPTDSRPSVEQNRVDSWGGNPDQPISPPLTQEGSATGPESNWNENDKSNYMGSQWHGAQEGSGLSNPEVPPTSIQEEIPEQHATPATHPPIPPQIENVPPILPHPPLPPPEVWVPAKLSPGQPMSPILLIREYSIEGPLYGQEDTVTRLYNAAHNLEHAPLCMVITNVFLFSLFY